MARAALGEIGLFMDYKTEIHRKRVEELYEYLQKAWGRLSEKVGKEIKKILEDQQYVKNCIMISAPH